MEHQTLTEDDSHKAKRIWRDYQERNDVAAHIGQTVGIDPKSERIWFGESALEIVQKRLVEGLTSPLFFERVGDTAYLRKGGRR